MPRIAHASASPADANSTERSFIHFRPYFNMLRQRPHLGQPVLVSHHAQLPSENAPCTRSVSEMFKDVKEHPCTDCTKHIKCSCTVHTSIIRSFFSTKSSWNHSHLPTSHKTLQLIWPVDHKVGRSGANITRHFPETVFCLLLFTSSSTEPKTIPKFRQILTFGTY